MKIVEVTWNDAHVSTESMTTRQAEKVRPVLTKTIAYLLAETDEGLTLCTDSYPDTPKEGKIINFVPWGMIVEWEYLCG